MHSAPSASDVSQGITDPGSLLEGTHSILSRTSLRPGGKSAPPPARRGRWLWPGAVPPSRSCPNTGVVRQWQRGPHTAPSDLSGTPLGHFGQRPGRHAASAGPARKPASSGCRTRPRQQHSSLPSRVTLRSQAGPSSPGRPASAEQELSYKVSSKSIAPLTPAN